MTKTLKFRAHLVAVSKRHKATYIYARLAVTTAEALLIAATSASPRSKVEVVGGLSRDLVKRLRLKPGEMRLI